jgi:hypothetical protein
MSPAEEKDFERMMRLLDEEGRVVMGDPQVWLEEATRVDPAPLPWPLAGAKVHGYEKGVLAIAFHTFVEATVEAIAIAEGETVVKDPADPDFQMILRVAERAVQRGDKAVRSEFEDLIGPVYGKREFLNKVKAALVEQALRAGGKVPTKIAKAGVSKSAYYRALHRKT